MFKNKKVSLMIVSALALTLALGLMAFNSVSAAGPTDGTLHRGGPGGFKPGHGEDTYLADALEITTEELQAAMQEARASIDGPVSKAEMDAALAEVLGISVEELEAAREVAKEAAIEQALADGTLTKDDVALMEAREALKDYIIDNGADRDAQLADVLGITIEELEAAKEEGQRIPDLLEEAGMTQEDFEAAMQTAHQETLNQAVEDGVITQDQADLLEEAGLNPPKGPNGHGGRGGHPGRPGDRMPGEKPDGVTNGTGSLVLPDTPVNEE